jgi:uncharacterized membrane protein
MRNRHGAQKPTRQQKLRAKRQRRMLELLLFLALLALVVIVGVYFGAHFHD